VNTLRQRPEIGPTVLWKVMLHVVADAGKPRAERPQCIAPIVCEQILWKPGKLAQDAIGAAAEVLIARGKVGRIQELRRSARFVVLGHWKFLPAQVFGSACEAVESGSRGPSPLGATFWSSSTKSVAKRGCLNQYALTAAREFDRLALAAIMSGDRRHNICTGVPFWSARIATGL
jgi:hypothetical protein